MKPVSQSPIKPTTRVVKLSIKPTTRVVKLRNDVYEKLHKAVATVTTKGWQHLSAVREDRPTMSSIIDEALKQMLKRTDKGR